MPKPVEGLLWLIILLSFSIILGVLLIGGSISLFLAPRMVPVVWLGFCVFCILSIFQAGIVLRDIRARRGESAKLYSLVFLIPVFLIVTASPQASTPQMLPNPNIGLNGIPNTAESISPSPEPVVSPSCVDPSPSPDTANSPVPAKTPTPEESPNPDMDVSDMPACVLGKDLIGQGSGSFGEHLFASLDELIGEEITLYGFVYKEDSFPPDTVLVGRLMITCCAADAMIVGYHVRVEDAGDFSGDEWIQVTGTVQRFSMEMYGQMYELPILTGGTVARCQSPPAEEAYVYP